MDKPQALLIHSIGSPLSPIQGLLESRGFSIRLSRSWEEAEQAYAALPTDEIKYVFADVTLCHGHGWDKFLHRARIIPASVILLCFHPQFPQGLFNLLASTFPEPTAENSSDDSFASAIVGESETFRTVLSLANKYAQHDITALITGETGTGKEVIARYIHNQSLRRDMPFVGCNMTAIPESLVESELFGYVRGAFTGADRNKRGLIEAAEGGTLFLDEIGDLPLAIQLKLLRFLESREFYKVGESSPKTANVRIIAATNKDLEKAILNDAFRKDLYYRLNSARIILPPLRERKEDIILLVANFAYQFSQFTQTPLKKISSSVKALFLDYAWPGNIRELKSVIESAVMVADGEHLTLGDLPMNLQQYATSRREHIATKAIQNIEEAEKTVIEETLKRTNGNKAKAAEALGVSVRTLYRKLEKFGLGAVA